MSGRPIKAGASHRMTMGFECPAHLRSLLENAATKNCRSLSAEMIARLEQSFRDDRIEAELGEIRSLLLSNKPKD